MIDLALPANRPELARSTSQQTREATERWVDDNLYCVNCGHDLATDNTPARLHARPS